MELNNGDLEKPHLVSSSRPAPGSILLFQKGEGLAHTAPAGPAKAVQKRSRRFCPACAGMTESGGYARFPNIRRFLLGLLATGLLLGWALGAAAEGVNTFEGNGVIEQLHPISEQIVIDGQHYALPTAVALQATDRHGAKVTLKRGMLVSFYGSVLSRTRQIQGISFLRWSEQ